MSNLASIPVPAEAVTRGGLPVFSIDPAGALPLPKPALADTPTSSQPLSVLIVYEDLHSRLRAIDACQQTSLEQAGGPKLNCSWWSFEFLNYPTLTESAARAAGDADMIICSIRTLHDLPESVKSWIDRWLQAQRTRAGTFVVLADIGEAEPDVRAPVLLYLQNAASQGNMTFFVRFARQLDEDTSFTQETLSRKASTTTGVLAEILNHGNRPVRWGINE